MTFRYQLPQEQEESKMLTAVLVVLGTSFLLGFTQSLLVGLYAGNWDIGTGVLWGIIICVLSLSATIWLQWYGLLFASVLSLLVGFISGVQVFADKRRAKNR
jgi:hypothetical protein